MFKILFLILILALLFVPQKKASRSLTWLFLLSTFLVMGLRHMYCYQDTFGYVQHYNDIRTMPWEQITDYFNKDVIFWYLSKAISFIAEGNYTIWLLSISFIYLVSFYNLMKKESMLPAVSALVMIVIGLYYFAFTGLRQTLALAFITQSTYYLLNREAKKALMMTLIASVFHSTSLVFLLSFPFVHIKLNKKTLAIYLIVGLFIYSLGTRFSAILNSITITDRFAYYADSDSALSFTGFFIKLILLISSYYFLGNTRNEYKNIVLIHLAIIGLITQSLSIYIAEMFRISMYFSISYVILFANSLSQYRKRTGRIKLPVLLVVLFLAYILVANNSLINKNYFFFFDNPIGIINSL